ncbi:MAG TPA: RDD family protein [Polyangia bacterium]|jgi:uncharacterized RDD family membrane protein YckC|nr:RDD family protein [Polyangia bacterium]
MQLNPAPEQNPYAPPTSDVDAGVQTDLSGSQVPADRGTRLAARMLDGLLYIPALFPGAILTFLFFVAASDSKPAGAVIAGMAVCAMGWLGLSIYQWSLISRTGQSLGKRWLRIRIVRVDGRPVDFTSGVILRSWVPFLIGLIPYVGILFGLIDSLCIFSSERRCLHDGIAGTKVIAA